MTTGGHDGTELEPTTQDSTMTTYTVAGARVGSRADWWAELGRAVNGPGGYFGRNLDALADCLRGDFGTPAGEPFTVRVTDAARVAAVLGDDYWRRVRVVFRHAGVPLLLDDAS